MISLNNDFTVNRSGNAKISTLHTLTPKTKIFNDFYVFDTETGVRKKDGINWCLRARPENFIFGCIHGYNYTKTIHSRKEFIETLLEPRFKGKLVFAHNLSYDLGVLYGNIFELDNEAIFIGSRIIKATNGNCIFADSLNIFNTSVEKLGEMIGIKKPSLGNDAMISKEVGPDEINRCASDCLIVWNVLFDIFEHAGDIKLTQASLSLTYFRRFHQKFKIRYNENVKYFWQSYFGGRCEAFKKGKTHAQVIDINSMYPFAMREVKFPNPEFLAVKYLDSIKELKTLLKKYEGVVKCEVIHKENWIGYLPVKINGKTVFPVGHLKGVWNFNELKFALDKKMIQIISVEWACYAEPMISPFVSYVNHLYAQRIASKDDIEIYRIKIFMNSLYGKFAQRIKTEQIYFKDYKAQWKEIEKLENRLIKLQLFNKDRKDCFAILRPKTQKIVNHSIPVFSSYITSFARIYLLDQLEKLKKFRPVYCDTDSIFYEIHTNEIELAKGLGKWKLEDKIVTYIGGLKNYKAIENGKEIEKIKGVPKKSKKVGPNSYEYQNLIKPKEALKRGIDSGILTDRKKTVTGKYDKRVLLDNGETTPIII